MSHDTMCRDTQCQHPTNGSVFKGICEPANDKTNFDMCKQVIRAFKNTEHALTRKDYRHESRIKAFEACIDLRTKVAKVNANSEIWDDCHKLAGRFGPADYMEWQQRYSQQQRNAQQ